MPIALAHVKTGNTSDKLLTEICKIIYYLYKEITKKVYNNTMNVNKVRIQNGYYIFEFWEQ